MPLEISSLKFDYISGPTSLALIVPHERLKEHLKDTSLMPSPILLIGDTHEETTYNCGVLDECITKESNCTSTFSPLFFRCLDTLTNEDYPIDIFLEVGIFPRFLKDPYLFDETRFKSLFDTNDGVMTYIPRYHSTCFSTVGKSQEMCFTKNIRYHLSDIRYQPSFLKLLDNEKSFITIANNMMKTDTNNLTLEEIYTMSEELNKDKNNSKMLDNLEHFPTFESYLFYSLENVVNNIILRRSGSMFFDKDVEELFNTLLEDPYKLIEELIKLPQFKTKSMIYKRIKESIFKEDFCLKLFKEYVNYYFIKNPIKKGEYCKDCVSSVKSLEREIRRKEISGQVYRTTVNSIKDATDNCANELFVPIMDFYFLVTSWKQQYKNSLMSVYIAGDVHVKQIRKFLMIKGYCKDYFSIYNNPIINDNKYLKGELIRCIEIPKSVPYSIDDILREYFTLYSQNGKVKMLINKSNLQRKRIKYFGVEVVQDMLNGKAYSKDKLIESYVKHTLDNTKNIKGKSFLDDLEMDFIAVPKDYKDKRLTI